MMTILKIYADDKFQYPEPELITNSVLIKMNLLKVTYDRLLGNKAMFDENKRTFHREINKSFWNKTQHFQTVSVRKPKKYDELGSVGVLTQLIKNKAIKIDINCRETAKQFAQWKIENSKFEATGLQQAILLILSELLGVK